LADNRCSTSLETGGTGELQASLPKWTTLGFGDGTTGGEYGLPNSWSCAYNVICPAAYGEITGRQVAGQSFQPHRRPADH
jgi:hypothetical protein